MVNTKTKLVTLLPVKFIRFGKKRFLFLTTRANELILPKSEQIPSDYFRKGDNVRAIVYKVELRNNNPLIILSRTAPAFLERLFELEIPEIFDGLITIKKIVRVPGRKSKSSGRIIRREN